MFFFIKTQPAAAGSAAAAAAPAGWEKSPAASISYFIPGFISLSGIIFHFFYGAILDFFFLNNYLLRPKYAPPPVPGTGRDRVPLWCSWPNLSLENFSLKGQGGGFWPNPVPWKIFTDGTGPRRHPPGPGTGGGGVPDLTLSLKGVNDELIISIPQKFWKK